MIEKRGPCHLKAYFVHFFLIIHLFSVADPEGAQGVARISLSPRFKYPMKMK